MQINWTMSALLNWSDNEVKYWWTAVIYKYDEWIHSDAFFIKNAESKFTVAVERHQKDINVRIQKQNIEAGNAIVKLCVNDLRQLIVEAKVWKDYCNILNVPVCANDDQPLKITIVCEVKWQCFVKDMPPPENLYQDVKYFLMNLELSDVVIAIGNEEIPAHKIVLGAQSPVFLAMFTTNMKEQRTNRVAIKGIDIDIMKKVLSYMYTGEIAIEQDANIVLQMLAVAELYQIEKLKKMCQIQLSNNLTVNNVLNVLDEANLHNAQELREDAIKYMVNHRKEIVKLEDFEILYKAKADLLFDFVIRIGLK